FVRELGFSNLNGNEGGRFPSSPFPHPSSRVSHPCLPSSSRAIALIVLPSARPLNWGRTLPITAPIWVAPPAIAALTAARSSSSLTCAGRYFSSAAASAASLSARSARFPLVY